MKKEKKYITASWLDCRELYEKHIGPLPGDMTYQNALKLVIQKIGQGVHKSLKQVRQEREANVLSQTS